MYEQRCNPITVDLLSIKQSDAIPKIAGRLKLQFKLMNGWHVQMVRMADPNATF